MLRIDGTVADAAIAQKVHSAVDLFRPSSHHLLGHEHIVLLEVLLQVAVNCVLLENNASAVRVVENVPCANYRFMLLA